jgi:hypothetical protein
MHGHWTNVQNHWASDCIDVALSVQTPQVHPAAKWQCSCVRCRCHISLHLAVTDTNTAELTPLPFFRRRFLSAAGAGATACQSAPERLLRAGLAGGAALPPALPPAAACAAYSAAPGVEVPAVKALEGEGGHQ